MVNGISNSNMYMNSLQTQTARGRPNPAEMFNEVDSDGSGGISQSELETFVQNMSTKTGKSVDTTDAVSTYDADGDGELSEEELKSFMEANMAPPGGVKGMGGGRGPGGLFEALDTDSSSGISQSELDEWAETLSGITGNSIDTTDAVSTYDADGDGELSGEELKTFMEASGVMPPPPPPPGGRGMMGGMSSEDESSTSSADSIISAYDTDGDGVLSSSELQGFLDDTDMGFSNTLVQQALSAYTMNFGGSGSSEVEDVLLKLGGFNGYSAVDLLT